MRKSTKYKGAEAERKAKGKVHLAELSASAAFGAKGTMAKRTAKGEVQSAE